MKLSNLLPTLARMPPKQVRREAGSFLTSLTERK